MLWLVVMVWKTYIFTSIRNIILSCTLITVIFMRYLSSQMDQTVVNGSVAAAVDNGTTGGAPGSVSGTNWTTAVSDFTPVLSPFESWQKVIIVLVIGVCMVLTITGNILVLVSFIVDRTIRQPSNYFIASLAATDMLIGRVSVWDLKNAKTNRQMI